MTESRKQLKIASYLVLLFAAISTIRLALAICFGELNSASIPEGSPENILLITKIILVVVSAAILIPQFYVGFKGLKVAKKPSKAKAHINCAIVLLVLTVLSLIEPVVGIVLQKGAGDYIGTLLDLILEGIIYFDYIRYAKAVAKGK